MAAVSYAQEKASRRKRANDPGLVLGRVRGEPAGVDGAVRGLVDLSRADGLSPYGVLSPATLAAVRRVVVLASGSSWHAALVGKYMLETLCSLPVEVELASEFRYRSRALDRFVLVVALLQAGEPADMLVATRAVRASGTTLLAITETRGSAVGREASGVLYIHDDHGGATPTFGVQLVGLAVLAIRLARAQGSLSITQARDLIQALMGIPRLQNRVLATEQRMATIAQRCGHRDNFVYLARGINVPVALEGALTLKEISDVRAEGHAAGELTPRLLALIDTVPVLVIAPQGRLHDKLVGCIDELRARGALVVALTTDGDRDVGAKADYAVGCPAVVELFEPLVFSVAVQLLSCHIAMSRERSRQSRNTRGM
jgi:glucosamine--fructose-6-phosphate aminotransferase (isomerizing)